jgi:hypothetical protein
VNSNLQNLYGRLRDGGVPAQAMEARLAWSRWQSRAADRAGAIATMAGLAEQAVFFREALPGVLDGWLLQRMPALETDYLAPLVRAGNGFDALLALARLRRLAGVPGRAGDLADDNFRALLARSAQGGDAATAAEIQARLAADYQTHARAHPDQTAAGLRQWLASLGGDQARLTWHIADTTATAWVARGDNVRMVRLDDAGGTAALAARAREQLPILEGPAFDALTAQLGERLLGPIAEHLPQRLLVAPAGPLLGLPLDALGVNERYLVDSS